jgi:single-strand DNA-binding protein
MSLNKVHLIGNLGSKPEMRKTAQGVSVATFSVATNEKWKDKNGVQQEKAEWHRVVAWDKLAEVCDKYLDKGKKVYVEGKLKTTEYEKDGSKRYATDIVASVIQFLDSAGGSGGRPHPADTAEPPQSGRRDEVSEDDIPL